MFGLLCCQGLAKGKLGILARQGSCRLPKGSQYLVYQEGSQVGLAFPRQDHRNRHADGLVYTSRYKRHYTDSTSRNGCRTPPLLRPT